MLLSILLAAILPAVVAVLVISAIPAKILGKMGRALSLIATGLLLTISLAHLIPEAMHEALHEGHDIHTIGLTLWATVFALIALEMYFNSRLQKHDGTSCSCPCHLLEQPASNRKLINPNYGNPYAKDQASSEGQKEATPAFTIKDVRPQGAPIPAHVHQENHCHHGIMQHFGHDHDFNLHGSDIQQAQDYAKSNAEKGQNSMQNAFAQGAAAILSGAALHALCDGVVIASSFLIDFKVGAAITAAIIFHEVPQQLSNYVLMLTFGMSKVQGFIVNGVAALGSIIGSLLFYFILDNVHGLLPYALAVSGASFVYVALSDILPRLNKNKDQQKLIFRCGYLFLGAVLAMLLSHH